MQNETPISTLNDKISQIIEKYNSLKEENDKFKMELITLKAEKEVKAQEIEKLLEENVMKDLEIEEIVNKIETMLS